MIEFVTFGVLMMVPLIYLVLTLGRLQAAAFATEAASRAAARAYTSAATTERGSADAEDAVLLALGDQGFAVDPQEVISVSCQLDPCLQPQAKVSVRVRVDVPLPGVPALVDHAVPVHVPVEATSVAVVDRFLDHPAAGAPPGTGDPP